MNSLVGNVLPVLPQKASLQDQSEGNRYVEELFSQLAFSHPLRKYQTEILNLVNERVQQGEREIHVVAPPGAGKTIIGLQMVLNFKRPSLILSPNTTIQSQWSHKLDLFLPPHLRSFDTSQIIGTHEVRPLKPITVLTYQVLSTPGREQEYLTQLAQKEWVNELRASRLISVGEAELRILELLQNNPRAHQKEMSRHLSRIRRKLTDVLKLDEVLHKNALDLIQSLRRQEVGLVIFDECHHLTDYWAAIMAHLLKALDDPIVVALTGTPPEGKSSVQENRYASLVGSIHYQVPTPALVREGGLAPFQDLVYFTQPTVKELDFLESQHEDFHALVDELTGSTEEGTRFSTRLKENGKYEVIDQLERVSPLLTWILCRVIDASESEGWDAFQQRRPILSLALLRCLYKYRLPVPRRVVLFEASAQPPMIDDWMCLLEDFASYRLKTSSCQESHQLYERIKRAARKLGYGITERGLRKQASPADRVLAFSKSKARAVSEILMIEYGELAHRLRAICVTDFERMSATGLKSVNGVLDEESGGAVGVFRELLNAPVSARVNPCLVTGSLLLIDFRIKEEFIKAAEQFIEDAGLKLPLAVVDLEDQSYCQITGDSSQWESRLYVRLATELFERGISKCLIGTRGLFGEGWDSQALNTLLDLTTTTAPVSVKQLRGRSIRIQTNDPLGAHKVANNWDIVCIAPQLEKGLNDYNRFVRKHESFFGITDDGQIERGVGHVHPSLSELTPLQVFQSHDKLNAEMITRALRRDLVYDLWKVGLKYENRTLGCLEITNLTAPYLTPPHLRWNLNYKQHAAYMRAALFGTLSEFAILGVALSLTLAYAFSRGGTTTPVSLIPLILLIAFGIRKYKALRKRFQNQIFQHYSYEQNLRNVAKAVLSAMKRQKFLPNSASSDKIVISERSNGCFRLFLEDVDYESSKAFVAAVSEALAPLTGQPFVIQRTVLRLEQSKQQDQFFNNYLFGKAKQGLAGYHAVPSILAKSEKGKEAFQAAWNKYVSPGQIVATEANPNIINKYFGVGPSLAKRLLWE